MSGDSSKIESLDRAVLRVGDAEVPVTLEDAKAIQAALLAYLKQSDYEGREGLIGWTQGQAWIDAEGTVRIGPWLLGADGQGLFARYREPGGQHMARAHRASLIKKDGNWTISGLMAEHISARR